MNTSTETKEATLLHTGLRKKEKAGNLKRAWPLHLMVLPAILLVIVFSYVPMAGAVIAFQDYKPWNGFIHSKWVGLEHFRTMFEFPDIRQVIWNTLIIASMKIICLLIVPILFSLLLNEVRSIVFKRTVQTMVYLPHFLSWVILSGVLIDVMSDKGLVNQIIAFFGFQSVFFFGDGNWFRVMLVVSAVWKEFGFSTIIFLAALSGINPSLYEAAEVDGANRWKQTLHITLPAIVPIISVVATLSLGGILNGDFDQVFNLYNSLVYDKGDILDTYVYRTGLVGTKYSFGAAVGMFKSVVSLVLILITYRLAYKFANYRIF
ncbi:putative aldouronate transport system permease protein [Paenibacillus rhizosphaerae]|uniref:Putative aldouronate transport system permease protein n=1 Tax=Paenibacillus rhizosphaerae TaxID=297318 RepID=A0A839TJT2_9BACL|nr:putative aldouronate transport system permease protein [Paenibacillus rhizosphaerae]